MVVGTTLMVSTTGAAYYSPTFPRGGEAALFSVEVTQVHMVTFTVDVEHRNEEDTAWTSAGAFTGVTAVGVSTKDVTGIKELLRLKYTVAGSAGSSMVHFIMPEPAWRPY